MQVEVAGPLGPPDGRYVVRADPAGPRVDHVLVLSTHGARQQSRWDRRRVRPVDPEPEPALVPTGRATVVWTDLALSDETAARAWLRDGGPDGGGAEGRLAAGLSVLDRALAAFGTLVGDPGLRPVARNGLLAARIGYGAGEQVADGRWLAARDLHPRDGRAERRGALAGGARFAAVLGGRDTVLVCETLVVRARADLSAGRTREAALQTLVALDAALAELPGDPVASALVERLAELRALRAAVVPAAQAALQATPDADARADLIRAVDRLQATLRARDAARG